jgi:hypothetical protein
MVRVLLIGAVCACSAPATPATSPGSPRPATETSGPPGATETLWDHGTFVEVDGDQIVASTEEAFEIYKAPTGYRFVIKWKRPLPTGELGEGAVTLVTDDRWRVLSGEMQSSIQESSGKSSITLSRITRQPDGKLATEIDAAYGTKQRATSLTSNDWYIGGTTTTFLTAMCQVDASVTNPTVFPDKETTLEPLQLLPLPGSTRETMFRRLTYKVSERVVVAACENGKLVGEYTRGHTIVRDRDVPLARVLESRFR